METEKDTTITIKSETWRRLMTLKMYPSQTWDAIINSLIDYKSYKPGVKNAGEND